MSQPPTQANVPPAPPAFAPATGRDLLRLAVRAGVLTEEQVREFLHAHPLAGIAENPTETGDLLVLSDILERLQVELLLLGCPHNTTLGRYRLDDVIGKGGMATVFLATDTVLRREVAVKVTRAWGEFDDLRERFRRESLAAATLAHPNVVRTYDVGVQDGVPFLVLERLSGRSLHAVRQRGPIPTGDVIEFLGQSALGLQAVHDAGLVHRDVKPGNLMLCRDGTIKLLDLGLVRFTDPPPADETDRHKPLTRTLPALSFVGTPQYLAPEQVLDSAGADHRADIFGLGATLYYLMTARPPRVELTLPLAASGPADTDEAFADLPPAVAELGVRMLASNPNRRPQSAAEVADALDAALSAMETNPRLTRRTTTIVNLPRPRASAPPAATVAPAVRRRARWPLVAGAAAVVLVCGLVASALWWRARPAVVPVVPTSGLREVGVLVPPGKPVRGLALGPGGAMAAVTTFGGETQLWDVAERRATATLPSAGARCSAVGFTADGGRVVYGASRTAIGVWDVRAGLSVATFEATDWVLSAAIQADGSGVAAGDRAGRLWVWDVATGRGRSFEAEAKGRVDVAAYPPGRSRPVFGFAASGAVWAWRDGEPVKFPRPGGWVFNGMCAVGPDRVATATAAEVVVAVLTPGATPVTIQATPAGSQFKCVAGAAGRVVTGGSDGTVRVWDAGTGRLLESLAVVPQPLVVVAVSPDGTDILAATADGCVRHLRAK